MKTATTADQSSTRSLSQDIVLTQEADSIQIAKTRFQATQVKAELVVTKIATTTNAAKLAKATKEIRAL